MAINHHELVSALVDGQLTGKELGQTLALIENDPAARAAFIGFQRTSDMLHGYTRIVGRKPVDLTVNLASLLEAEPTYSVAKESRSAALLPLAQNFWKQAIGLAMAASVGALAVIGVMQQQTVDSLPLPTVAANDVPAALISQSNRWTVAEPEVEDRLNNYLVDHNEYVGTSGMFSYGRVVSYGAEQ